MSLQHAQPALQQRRGVRHTTTTTFNIVPTLNVVSVIIPKAMDTAYKDANE